MTKIKICGLKRPEDIEAVNRYGPDYCGFIVDYPQSHRNLNPDQVRTLVQNLDRERITPVGVFVNSPMENVAKLLNDDTVAMAQLHGTEDEEYLRKLRTLTDKPVIKAFPIREVADLKKAAVCSADYLLLDRGKGEGKSFDWELLQSPEGAEAFSGIRTRNWFLAGGLSLMNIEEAITKFHPWCVDLSSAVETDRRKDPDKIREMIEKVRRMER